MIRRTLITKIILICSLLFYNCNYCSMNLYSNITNADKLKNCNSYFSPSKNDVLDVDESQLIDEIPNANIKLYFVEKDENYALYKEFILQINGVKGFFRWENATNPTYAPELLLSDLDKDGKDELIIILTKGYGTSLRDQEVHVIKLERFFYEILVENPNIILHKNVEIKEDSEDFEILLNNKKILYSKNEVLIFLTSPSISSALYSKAITGSRLLSFSIFDTSFINSSSGDKCAS